VAFWLSVLRLGVVLPALVVATRWGIQGVAVAQAGAAMVLALTMQVIAVALIDLSPRFLAKAVAPAVAGAGAVLAGSVAVRLWLPGPAPVRLAAAVVAGVMAAAIAIRFVDRAFMGDVRALLSRRGAPDVAV